MDYRDRWELKDYLVGQTLNRRIRLLQVGVATLLIAFSFNFWQLQGIHGEEYADLAENNRLRRIPTLPTRGTILDRHSEALASTRPSLDLVLVREDSDDLEAELGRLAPILGVEVEALAERAERGRHGPAFEPLVLQEDVPLEALARIAARRELFPSLQVRETARRRYVHGDLFAHVIGYVGEAGESEIKRSETLQMGDIVGKTGLERGYDDWLRGMRGWNLITVNNLGRRIGESWVASEPGHGQPLELTLDLEMQRELRLALGDETGAGVFIDVRTGAVLAMASTPTFDPNLFADGMSSAAWQVISEDPRRPLHDRAIASFYAPGSVFKVLLAVAGLESGTVTPSDTVFCSGSAMFYGRSRLCWKKGGHGNVDMKRALTHSCNVYFYRLGKELGIDQIHKYGSYFGLGQPTGIDIPGESGGVLPSSEWKRKQIGSPWYPGDTISLSIGQGYLAVTPLQMATMIAAVANGGSLPRPRMRSSTPIVMRELPIDPHRLLLVRDALRQAVADGTGRSADVKGLPVAGKTGTAQVFKHSAGIDADEMPKAERDHAWFAGYAPADNPTIAFAVVVEHGGHGGTSASPIARRVLEVYARSRESRASEEVAAGAPAEKDRGVPASPAG